MLATDLSRPYAPTLGGAEDVYRTLLGGAPSPEQLKNGQDFLQTCLDATESLDCDLPGDPQDLFQWIKKSSQAAATQFAEYRDKRSAGETRQYFPTRSHALTYLRAIAPTKMVDGAWLYPVLNHWQDSRFLPLISTYLEELGEGVEALNHVVMFKKLLTTYGCEHGPALADDYYLQGAIQLSLGLNSDEFLPELIGYNLGYEQLPLHILITAYELKELKIDPYYFTVHICSDNASSGHAYKAVQSVLDLIPDGPEGKEFYQRVLRGFKLNDLGPGAEDIIHAIKPESLLIDLLKDKSEFGYNVHSDYCRIGGKTVNEWLQDRDNIPEFLQVMQKNGWIKRHQDPHNSRFWHLIEGPKAKMLGVFSPLEAQLLYDWIAGDWLSESARHTADPKVSVLRTNSGQEPASTNPPQAESILELRRHLRTLPAEKSVQCMIDLMAPHKHTSPEGLFATQRFTRLVYS